MIYDFILFASKSVGSFWQYIPVHRHIFCFSNKSKCYFYWKSKCSTISVANKRIIIIIIEYLAFHSNDVYLLSGKQNLVYANQKILCN